ncbi:MAG: hypothetical protein WCW44_03200 [archaeon]|jgi:hypothetical protein
MKGFFGFAVAIAMLVVLLYFSIGNNENQFAFEKTKNELMKAEQANKERTLLENNSDRIISTKLEEQILVRNYNVVKAQSSINSALANYLKGKTNATNLFFESHGEVNTTYLTENSSVMILTVRGVTYAEYTYTSTPLLNTIVSKKLGEKIITYFKIPIGYSQKKLEITG